MKFNHKYQQQLLNDGFPQHWVESAISYGRLKKCIKRVGQELSTIGLDVNTLNQLLKSVEEIHKAEDGSHDEADEPPFEYRFEADGTGASSNCNSPTINARKRFVPKLLFAVDEVTGEPVDATLSTETKNYLHQLAIAESLTNVRITDEETASTKSWRTSDSSSTLSSDGSPSRQHSTKAHIRLIEVPLTSDSEFFSVLQKEVFGLDQLQKEEQKQLTSKIIDLGHSIAKLTNPTDNKSKHDIELWRKVFDAYITNRVFFATTERDHGSHNHAKAQQNFATFLNQTRDIRFKKHDSVAAFQSFVEINLKLLQSLKFQELNQTAVSKIVKKFDKRTGLGVKEALPPTITPAVLSPDFARNLSAAVASQIVATVPRLDDYQCPVCFSIAFRPVRLRCGHLFCIRCLITMQRERKDRCPLCREAAVLEANSSNIDPALAEFLKRYFPSDVKAKQRENEAAAARDQFGELYDARCAVM